MESSIRRPVEQNGTTFLFCCQKDQLWYSSGLTQIQAAVNSLRDLYTNLNKIQKGSETQSYMGSVFLRLSTSSSKFHSIDGCTVYMLNFCSVMEWLMETSSFEKVNSSQEISEHVQPLVVTWSLCQDFRPSVQHDCLWLGRSWLGFARTLPWGDFRIKGSQITAIQSLSIISCSNHTRRYPNLSYGQEASKIVQDAEGIKDSHDRRPLLRFPISHLRGWGTKNGLVQHSP